MLTFLKALARVCEVATERGTLAHERISLENAAGRVCAADIASPAIHPPFANSAVDGFAVRSALTQSASAKSPLRLRVVGWIAAGDAPPFHPAQDGAWEIMTGAPFPDGFDGSVRIEDTVVTRDGAGRPIEVEIKAPVDARQNWRGAGEDFQIGTPVVRRGQSITPEHVLALSSLGVVELSVFRRARVGLVSTGRELVPMTEKPAPGQIRNSTAPYLLSSLRQLGVDAVHLGTILDEPEEFRKLMLLVAAENFDLVLTTGAVSMGKYDFIADGIERLGAGIEFHKVAMRPGKPLLFAKLGDGRVFFGLPGPPVSGVVALRFFVVPYLRVLNAMPPEQPLRARLMTNSDRPGGLRRFLKARLTLGDGDPCVQILPDQMAFMVRPLLVSTAWAVLPESDEPLRAGAWIDVYPMHPLVYGWRESASGT